MSDINNKDGKNTEFMARLDDKVYGRTVDSGFKKNSLVALLNIDPRGTKIKNTIRVGERIWVKINTHTAFKTCDVCSLSLACVVDSGIAAVIPKLVHKFAQKLVRKFVHNFARDFNLPVQGLDVETIRIDTHALGIFKAQTIA